MGMPTAAKLIASVLFAALAFVAARMYAQNMPDGSGTGRLLETSALIGFLCGWSIIGSFASRPGGRVDAMATGVRTSFTMAVLVTLTFAIVEMLTRSLKGRYRDPVDAVLSMFELFLTLGRPILTPELLAVLLLGGIIGGAVAHWAGRTWR